jgi:hypothetical protein
VEEPSSPSEAGKKTLKREPFPRALYDSALLWAVERLPREAPKAAAGATPPCDRRARVAQLARQESTDPSRPVPRIDVVTPCHPQIAILLDKGIIEVVPAGSSGELFEASVAILKHLLIQGREIDGAAI